MVGDEPDRPGVIALPPLIYLGFFLFGLAADLVWPLPLLPQLVQYVVGLALIILSGVLIAWTLPMFRRADTSFDVRKPTTALIIEGPFRFSRNPAYLSLSLLYAGLAAAIDGLWIFVLLAPALVVMHYGVILREERYLERKFGDEYQKYKASARRWF